LTPDEAIRSYVIQKGAVALDGVSLTIADVNDHDFFVALIPTTLERTTLSELTPEHRVNVETDIITRTVVHRLNDMSAAGGLSMESLRKAGFL
jgi:riboflavin synthase